MVELWRSERSLSLITEIYRNIGGSTRCGPSLTFTSSPRPRNRAADITQSWWSILSRGQPSACKVAEERRLYMCIHLCVVDRYVRIAPLCTNPLFNQTYSGCELSIHDLRRTMLHSDEIYMSSTPLSFRRHIDQHHIPRRPRIVFTIFVL